MQAMYIDKKPLITAKQARQLMGEYSSAYSDAEIETMVQHLEIIAEILGKEASERMLSEVPKSTQGTCIL